MSYLQNEWSVPTDPSSQHDAASVPRDLDPPDVNQGDSHSPTKDAARDLDGEAGTTDSSPPARSLPLDSQKTVISDALEENDWNFTQTAQKLGIGRTTLWRKVKKYNLTRETVES